MGEQEVTVSREWKNQLFPSLPPRSPSDVPLFPPSEFTLPSLYTNPGYKFFFSRDLQRRRFLPSSSKPGHYFLPSPYDYWSLFSPLSSVPLPRRPFAGKFRVFRRARLLGKILVLEGKHLPLPLDCGRMTRPFPPINISFFRFFERDGWSPGKSSAVPRPFFFFFSRAILTSFREDCEHHFPSGKLRFPFLSRRERPFSPPLPSFSFRRAGSPLVPSRSPLRAVGLEFFLRSSTRSSLLPF